MQLPCCVVLIGPLVRAESWQNGRAPWSLLALGRRRRSPGSVPNSRVDDDRSMKRNDQGTRRGSTARARTLRQGKEKNGTRTAKCTFLSTRAREEQEEEEALVHPHAPRERELHPKREREPPMSVSFITRVCKYLGHRSPVGGATLAHWSGEKGGVYLPGSRHLHTRFSLSLDERLGGRFRRFARR